MKDENTEQKEAAPEVGLSSAEIDAIRAATRLAKAIRDIFNSVGELPEVNSAFESVYFDVCAYENRE